ncbi:hypothetical protein CYMTET_10789, partial [Cymbomonas tetramitiformis]
KRDDEGLLSEGGSAGLLRAMSRDSAIQNGRHEEIEMMPQGDQELHQKCHSDPSLRSSATKKVITNPMFMERVNASPADEPAHAAHPGNTPRRGSAPRKRSVTGRDSVSSLAQFYTTTAADTDTLQLKGYKDHWAGNICYVLMCLTSLHWVVIYAVIIVDNYLGCELGGLDNLCYYGKYYVFGDFHSNSRFFFGTWVLSTTWLLVWITQADRVRLCFRLPCSFGEAELVWVWMKREEELMEINCSKIIEMVREAKERWLWAAFQPVRSIMDGSSVRGQVGRVGVCKVVMTPGGKRYFEFEGTRYALRHGSYERVVMRLGQKCAFLRQLKGLSDTQAEERLEIVGMNHICMDVEPWSTSLANHFFTPFYLYQFAVYVVWYWFSYIIVGMLMSFVATLSGLIGISISRQPHTTPCPVQRI